ncbi:MAG TPA: metal-dependent hydrolase [Methanofastidiosum sp.]|nr:metal-dependent hydrolase [Methanofastidiosum sp.]HQF90355.1 metal-dependent hydrolase [Methanofastidiosum sp.]
MNAEGHLFVSGVFNILFIGIMYLLGINVFQMDILFLILIVFGIFSLLPDIDHPRSRISGVFYLSMIIIIVASGISFLFSFNPVNIFGILFGIGMLVLHGKYAEDSYNHRKFPHTIKFSLIACLILFFLLNSLYKNATYISIITLVGAISIFSHIWVDKYMYDTFLHFKNNVNYSVEITSEIALEKNISTKFNAIIVRKQRKGNTV